LGPRQSGIVGQDGILRGTGSPARRVTNPPQVTNLLHAT